MNEHGRSDACTYQYDLRNAAGDRSRLPALAKEIIAARPAVVFAAGGLEADALKIASQGSGVPVVFLAASTIERGLAESMARPGGNLTGVDTNDTGLTEKRLWYISKLFPNARRVTIFNIATITPSQQSTDIARRVAPSLGLSLKVIEVDSKAAAEQAAAKISRQNTDVILLLPVAPIDQIVRETLLPISRAQKIPIMGYNEQGINNGALVAYGSSRKECGAQVARLAIKVLHGNSPGVLAVETPDQLELTINRWLVNQLDLKLSSRAWRMVNQQVEIPF